MSRHLTDAQTDAAMVRSIAERVQLRGDKDVADLAYLVARLIEDCADMPPGLSREVVTMLAAARTPEPRLQPECPRCALQFEAPRHQSYVDRQFTGDCRSCGARLVVTGERVWVYVTTERA